MPDYLRSDSLRPNAELRPEFFMDTVRDDAASAAAGREIYKEVERVKIIIPGMTATIVVHNVNSNHVQRWPAEYDAFKRNEEMPLSGTPLEQWCLMTPSRIKELKYHEIRTVEELANLQDNAVSRLGPGMMQLRAHARAFLNDAAHESLRTKLQAECDGLRSTVEAMQNQIDELNKHFAIIADENRRYAEEAHMRRAYAEGPAGYRVQPAEGASFAGPAGRYPVAPPPAGYPPEAAAAPVGAIDSFNVPLRRSGADQWPPEEQGFPPTPYVDEREASLARGPETAANPPAPPAPPRRYTSDNLRGDVEAQLAAAGVVPNRSAPMPENWANNP